MKLIEFAPIVADTAGRSMTAKVATNFRVPALRAGDDFRRPAVVKVGGACRILAKVRGKRKNNVSPAGTLF